jgi:hypothetical protein
MTRFPLLVVIRREPPALRDADGVACAWCEGAGPRVGVGIEDATDVDADAEWGAPMSSSGMPKDHMGELAISDRDGRVPPKARLPPGVESAADGVGLDSLDTLPPALPEREAGTYPAPPRPPAVGGDRISTWPYPAPWDAWAGDAKDGVRAPACDAAEEPSPPV